MRNQNRQIGAAVFGLAFAVAAAAPAMAEKEGWYVIGNGYHTQVKEADSDDFRVETTGTPPLTMSTIVERHYNAGFESDTSGGLQIGFDYRGPFRTDLELRSFENKVDRRQYSSGPSNLGPETLDTKSAAFNFWYDFNHLGAVRPYVGLGVGYANVELANADDDVIFGQAGVGVNWFFTDRFALDVGYRHGLAQDPEFESSSRYVESEFETQSYVIGLRYNFFGGGRTIEDSDKDGVNDRADRCPGTPRNATVDRDGCALDSDGDGVADYLDNCANTPAGTRVDNVGCETSDDRDNDGVVNAKDQCPGTPAGEPVLENGCAASQSQVLQNVTFELNSAALTREGRQVCEDVARLVAGSKGFNIEVQGHTDNQGSAAYNRDLSQSRADNFMKCLIAEGVDASRLTAVGYGEAQPVASNDTAAGRQRNRRVELKVIKNR